MDVVCIIGDRVFHAAASACARDLDKRGQVLNLTEAQAHEVGMEPCGFCIAHPSEDPTPQKR
jgi:hypothetical protein